MLSKNASKALKFGVGAGAFALSLTNPVGWVCDMGTVATIGTGIASGFVMDKVANHLKGKLDKKIDENTKDDSKAKVKAKTTDEKSSTEKTKAKTEVTDQPMTNSNGRSTARTVNKFNQDVQTVSDNSEENFLSALLGGDSKASTAVLDDLAKG